MKKITLLFSLFLVCSFTQNVIAQASSKLFMSAGYSLHFSKIPSESRSFSGVLTSRRSNFIGVGYNFSLRYNIAELNDDNSLGLTGGIVLGADYNIDLDDFDGANYGGVYLPIHLEYNTGAGATYDTDKDFGFGIGVGLTPSYVPIFGSESLQKLRLSPSVKLSIRFWKPGTNSLSDYFVRFDKLSGGDSSLPGDQSLPFAISVGRVTYLGY